MKIAVIIPAYNEEERISPIIKTALKAQKEIKEIEKITVVDDHSEDKTFKIAKKIIENDENSEKNTIFTLPKNHGKGNALLKGIEASPNQEILFFIDADLKDFNVSHIKEMIEFALKENYDFVNGVLDREKQFRKKIFSGNFIFQKIINLVRTYFDIPLSGIRVLRREIWNKAPKKEKFKIDYALYYFAVENNYKIKNIILEGVTQYSKVDKRGVTKGWRDRFKMYCQVIYYFIKIKFLEKTTKKSN